ncbi:MAG: hypothetical protein JWN11_1174 [Hyphomicrobiales bacterium]|nr:hypothetical protein [Hyphomicrobiales bacterium]
MSVVEFSFPDQDPAQASQIAQALRMALVENGIPPERMALTRDNPESMSLASELVINGPALFELGSRVIAGGALLAEVATIAHTVYEVCIREHCAVHVKTPKGIVQIGPGEIEIERLRAVLRDAFDADPGN